ncbi:uncharacterized protein (DUF779 family) [Oikeobacillus pervagus]|uniref:Uncharacterized protein (DUF779 family) n=1 Tax=Oikeobacillus pervagus TaxID=1325931 RepID=A0AAJ1T1Y4_9BACI|nr:DUF779 domain-containing protein [Oikeobacillus pervagus]MDQ0214449.1 uncharacterized protein (DUF779 family) [Oikeobacillus pervagus]
MVERVVATDEALKLIQSIKNIHGAIMFYQSGGCCDGSAPMCYSEGDFLLGDSDIYLGSIGDTPFYMHKSQYDYWKHTQLIIDVAEGGGATFSLDSVEDKHFITRSRVFTEEEYEEVKKLL